MVRFTHFTTIYEDSSLYNTEKENATPKFTEASKSLLPFQEV